MSLQCSVFGHKFGEQETRTDRTERESEVITTVKEVKTCTRCGKEQIISQNKEITTIEDARSDPESSESDTEESTEDHGSSTAVNGIINRAEAGSTANTGMDLDTDRDPADDDAVILEETSEAEEPDSAEPIDPENTSGEWPDDPGEAEATEEAKSNGDEITEAEEVAAQRSEPDQEDPQRTTANSTVWSEEGTFEDDDAPITYECPACGYTERGPSATRPGDMCPECHEGYIQERE